MISCVNARAAAFGLRVNISTREFVAELRPPLNIDNMEGISVTREGGKTMLWMISDDNRMPVERTLLLKFQLVDNSGDGGDLNIKKPGR